MAEAQQAQARKLPYVAAITEGVRAVLLEQDNAFHRRLKQDCDPSSLCDGSVIFG